MSDGVLVRGGHVLTGVGAEVIADGAVRIRGSTIDGVGTWGELRSQYPDDRVEGGPHDLVTPGFINLHGHFSEGLVTGLAKSHTLWEWIGALVAPVAPHLDDEAAYLGTLLAGIQMLKSGITLANDMFVCDPRPEGPTTRGVVRALDELGLRGVVSFGAGDVRGAAIGAILEEHAALQEAAAASRLSSFRVGIAAIGAQSDELFEQSVELATASGAGSHIHLQEIREEVTAVRARYGVTPTAHCAGRGLFAAPTIAAHCVWVDRHDQELLAGHGVGVAHNPVSNMILASGVCPVVDLRRLGIPVGLGVDGAGSNDRQDMLEVIKLAVLLQRLHRLQATALDAQEAFEMSTLGGAAALGLQDRLGSLEPGKEADLVVFNGEDAALANVHDPVAALVYCAGPGQVKDVWVAGERSVAAGQVTRVDELEVVAKSRPVAQRLVARAGLGAASAALA